MGRRLLLLLAASSCGRISFDPLATNDAHVAGDGRCAFGPWTAPVLVTQLSTDQEEYSGTVSRGGTTVLFSSDRPGGAGGYDLYMATRASTTQSFSAPVNQTAINAATNESTPAISDDGLTLYFTSDLTGSDQLYTATRGSLADEFAGAKLLLGNFAGLGSVGSPEPSPDELTLYFDANAGGPNGTDIWMATRASLGDAWGTPAQVPGVNTLANEAAPAVDDGGLTLYYVSDVFEAPQDLVVSTRPDLSSPFSAPTVVPLSLDPGVGEYGADISADGATMELSIHLGAPLATNVFLSSRSCL